MNQKTTLRPERHVLGRTARHNAARILAVCAIALGAQLPRPAHAQQTITAQPGTAAPMQPTEAEMAQMRRDVETAAHYQLPKDFVPRMIATLQALRASGLQPPPPDHLSLNDTITRVSSVQGIDPVLRAHGFTPRDFVLGLTSFGMTVAILTNQQAQASGQAPTLNPSNVALIRSNPEAAQALMQEMNSQPQQ